MNHATSSNLRSYLTAYARNRNLLHDDLPTPEQLLQWLKTTPQGMEITWFDSTSETTIFHLNSPSTRATAAFQDVFKRLWHCEEAIPAIQPDLAGQHDDGPMPRHRLIEVLVCYYGLLQRLDEVEDEGGVSDGAEEATEEEAAEFWEAEEATEFVEFVEFLNDVHALWLEAKHFDGVQHPLPRILDELTPPTAGVAVNRAPNFIPARLAQVSPNERGGDSIFSFAAHLKQGSQIVFQGFPDQRRTPRVPAEFLSIGMDASNQGANGVSLALRATLTALSYRPWQESASGRFTLPARQFLEVVYAGRIPRGKRWQQQLKRASDALDNAWIPYQDPDTQKTGIARIALIHRLPSDLDDDIVLSVDLPPGSTQGPKMPPALMEYALNNRRAFYALFQLTMEWWEPGRKRVKMNGRWFQKHDITKSEVLDSYDAYLVDDLIPLTAPLATTKDRDRRLYLATKTLDQMEQDGQLQIVKGGKGRGRWWKLIFPSPKP